MAVNLFNAKQYIQAFLQIKTKDNKIVKMCLNEPQQRLYDVIAEQSRRGKPIRLIILKARQMGFSTLTEALIFHRTATQYNTSSLIIAHKEDATANLFRMSKLFYERLPAPLKPMRQSSTAYELIFANPSRNPTDKASSPGLNSIVKCATAGGSGIGRSDTYTNVHASEVAFWTGDVKDTLTGLLQAVPQGNNTMVILESTANGYNYFKELWDSAVNGDNDFVPVFFPWFEMSEYSKPYDGFELTDEEIALRKRFDLTLDQLTWRRWCIKNNCGGDIDLFKQEYPATPEEAFIATDSCVFPQQTVIDRINDITQSKTVPIKRGYFSYSDDGLHLTDIHWVDDDKGYIAIYEDIIEGCPYVIGGDTAGDGEGDYFTAHVLDNTTGRQVAVLWSHLDEDEYARQIYCLGLYYNTALVGIEVNFSSYPVKELARLEYPKLYVRETPDTYTGALKQSFGYVTSSKTRPVAIAELITVVRDNPELINDLPTLREMLSFVRINGKPQAESGQHDDLVMGLAIAYQMRSSNQQVFTYPKANSKRVTWEDDIWEDYYNADDEGKARLIERYGNPF